MCIICTHAKIYFRKTLHADLELTWACYLWLWLFLITARITVSCERGKKENKKCGDSLITSIPWFPQDPVLVKKSGAPVRRRWGAKSCRKQGGSHLVSEGTPYLSWEYILGHYFDWDLFIYKLDWWLHTHQCPLCCLVRILSRPVLNSRVQLYNIQTLTE